MLFLRKLLMIFMRFVLVFLSLTLLISCSNKNNKNSYMPKSRVFNMGIEGDGKSACLGEKTELWNNCYGMTLLYMDEGVIQVSGVWVDGKREGEHSYNEDFSSSDMTSSKCKVSYKNGLVDGWKTCENGTKEFYVEGKKVKSREKEIAKLKEEKKLLQKEYKRKALENEIAELKEKNKKTHQSKKKQPSQPKVSSGSGFFISKLGHIITNQHVVNKCSKITIGDRIDKQVPAQLLETDKRNDLALLRTTTLKMASAETKTLIQKLSIHIVPLATGGLMRGNDIELGEDVLVAGFPYGDIFSKNIKVTKGIVSSTTGVGDDSGQFQLDAAVQPGNSGGPIYDKYGNIVGVVVAQLNKFKMAKAIGSLPENVNFGIKASTVKQFLNTSGLPTKWSERKEAMSNQELSKIASKQTVMVVCHRD